MICVYVDAVRLNVQAHPHNYMGHSENDNPQVGKETRKRS